MNSRYPQPIKVGDLIGLPVLDYSDSTIGYVRNVVRTPAGKIQLIVTQGGWPAGWSTWRSRLVAVPIETVAILGRQLAALEMTREQFVAAPTWSEAERAGDHAQRHDPDCHHPALTREAARS